MRSVVISFTISSFNANILCMVHLTIKDVKRAVKEAGVSYNGTLFIQFAREGKITLPENFVQFRNAPKNGSPEDVRIYTPEEVEKVASEYIRLKKELGRKSKDKN